MFNFAWSEIAVIGVVALIAIGPKDLPQALRTIMGFVRKARSMAAEFQTHVDELVREADLGDVKKHIDEFRNMDVEKVVGRSIDPDGSLRSELNDSFAPPNLMPTPASAPVAEPAAAAAADLAIAERPLPTSPMSPTPPASPTLTPIPADAAPAFIPPRIANPPVRPAFIPPGEPEPYT